MSERERIKSIIKNLEGVLKTSRNEAQRIRVYKDIKRWQQELDNLPIESSTAASLNSYESSRSQESRDPLAPFDYLKHIPMHEYSPNIYNREINEFYTFLKYIEDEYLGLLSEYHLKLDVGHALTRDSFYTDMHDCNSALKIYAETIEKSDDEKLPKAYRDKLRMTIQSEYRNLVSKLGDFLRKLYSFVEELVFDYDKGGHLVLNAGDKLKFHSGLTGSHVLQGYTVMEGLKDLHLFLTELLEYLNLPEIKKKDK